MSSNNSRTDTANVGPIQEGEVFFPVILVSRGSVKDIAVACTNSNNSGNIKNVYFVQSSIYLMLTNSWKTTPYMPVLFQGLKEPSGSYSFIAINETSSAYGLLGNVVVSNSQLSINVSNSTSNNFILDPVSDSGSQYPTNLLLSALPYNIYDVNVNPVNVNLVPNTGVDNTANLGGLATGVGTSSSINSEILFVPLSFFIQNSCGTKTSVGTNVTQTFGSLQYNQCVLLPGTNYMNSINCKPLITGFTKQDECNQGGGLYSYCNSVNSFTSNINNSYCGGSASYTNLLTGAAVNTNSCKGWCKEGWCLTTNTQGGVNSCVMTNTGGTVATVVPWWVWGVIAGLVILLFLMAALYWIFSLRRNKEQ